MAALSSLTSSIQTTLKWTAQVNLTGSVYNPTTNSGNIVKTQSLGTSLGNTTSGGADELFSFQQAITAGSSATITLNAMTDILQRATTSIVRIKALQIRLLSATDDSTISPAPTATSTVTVTNIGVTDPAPLDFTNGGSGGTVTLTTSGGAVTAVAVGAAGSGYPKSSVFLAVPQQDGGSGCAFACVTDSSGTITSMVFVTGAGGTGYTNATVALVPAGQYNIYTGGTHVYFDPQANGFCALSSTAKNLKILNMDGTHAVTVEIDVIGCTT